MTQVQVFWYFQGDQGGLGRDMGACSNMMYTGNRDTEKQPFGVYV